MLIPKTYSCGICKTQPDQISHHKTHILTQKHKDKYELFELKLSKLSEEQLLNKYNTTSIKDICEQLETVIYKLNDNNNDNDINIKIDNQSSEKDKQLIMANINSISNKEALRDKIHDIHNLLRNNGAGYGMNALKVFNILFGLKKIEEKGLVDKVGLSDICKFSYLLEKAKNIDKTRLADEEFAELIFDKVLQDIYDNEKIKDLLFYEIPKNMKGSVLSHLIIEINDITKIEKDCNVLLSGKIYEYFIGRDESAISELGAYFTDRHIVDYILNKLSPCINDDGTISSMIDMFGGSGGFTTGYINYLNEKYKNGEINWETEINKINHFDMNADVIKSAGLEIFCLTGIFPNKNNLCYKNSFREDFDNTKYKYPITNPPYGGDKNKKSTAQKKREKIKEYIKKDLLNVTDEGVRIARQHQLKEIEKQEKVEEDNNKTKVCLENCSGRIQKYAHDNKLKGNDKEACSLILLMDILEVGGTAIGVLKEGVFFNSSYKDLRRCLIEKYNVREIISVPSDQFENTSTKTSIIIFDNTEEKTREVKFYDLVVERYTEDKFIESNGNILIVENKGDISGVSDTLVSVANREEILSNPIYSLNGKDYNKKVIVCGEGYELVKIGDICEFKAKSKRKASYGKKEGEYNFYTSSDKVQKCDIADYKDECLIIGSGGVANIKLDNEFSCSADNFILHSKYNKYLYSIIIGNMNILIDGFTGSVLKHLSKEYLVNLQIPIPKSEQKIQEWVDKISKPYDEKNSKQNKVKELEEYIQNKIKDITENKECEEIKIIDLCDIKSGKRLPSGHSYSNEPTSYYYLQVTNFQNNSIDSNNLKFINKDTYNILQKYDITENDIYISIAGTIGKVGIIPNQLNGSILTENAVRLTNIKINKIYLLYYLNLVNDKLIELSNMTTIKKLSIQSIEKIKIKIPNNKQLIKDLEPIFNEIEKLQGEVKEAETLYNNLIKELSDEAMPKTSEIIELTKDNIDTFEEITEVKEEKVPSIKSSVASSVASGTSIKSLKEQCKSLGIKGYSNKKKEELIKLIENHK